MADFVMPILGADMEAGTLVAWRKQPGDRVERGEIVADVETDKGAIEVEIFTSGVIERLLVQPGAKVPVGTVLAVVREDDAAAAPGPPAPAPPAPAAAAPPPAPGRARISPAARTRAAELGIDAATLAGTGPGGAVTLDDVERAAVAPADRHTRMRQTIAAAMARAKREIPHFYLGTTIDVQRTTTWLAETNRRRPVTERLLPGVLLVKAVALALREVPELNAVWSGGRAIPSAAVHVGVAISLRGGGLVAPALHDTDRRPLDDLMRAFRDLVQRARAGSLRSSELSDPTITVTSLGEQGVETVLGVIYPPQVAIVGFGRIAERPWAVAGTVVARPVVTATLSADHRVTDGHRAGRFLAALDRLLQAPEAL
jgi:pyruvate dehydrogenase E2 component (dihydrolipoamide acetyltransferase)